MGENKQEKARKDKKKSFLKASQKQDQDFWGKKEKRGKGKCCMEEGSGTREGISLSPGSFPDLVLRPGFAETGSSGR